MEKKQLDLNAPLLSVRRISSTLASLNIQNGAKIENSLPSRRYMLPSKTDHSLDQVTDPVAVPFLWEHIPGRAKSKSGPLYLPREKPLLSPRLPSRMSKDTRQKALKKEDQKVHRIQKKELCSNENSTKLVCSKMGTFKKESSDSEDNNDSYSDALDILSPTESFSFSCVSGLTGLGPNVKPSGTFLADPQIRDFMMNRFLPAAKAMALEPPLYIARKQPVTFEQPREVKRTVSIEKPLHNQYESSIVSGDSQENNGDESESEDEIFYTSSNISASTCGFLPRLCAKNSVRLFNPVPVIKGRSHSPKVYASEVRRMARAAYVGPQSQDLNKDACEASYNQKVSYRMHSHGAHKVNNKVDYKQSDESNQFAHSRGLQETNGLSPLRRSGPGCISPYRNQRPKSPFREGVGFLGIPKADEKVNKGCSKIQGVLPHQRNQRGSGSARFTIEKTLYIESITTVEKKVNVDLNASSIKKHTDSADEQSQIIVDRIGIEDTASAECTNGNVENSKICERNCVLLKPKVPDSLVADLSSNSNIPHFKSLARLDCDANKECRSLESSKISPEGNLNINSERSCEAHDTEESTVSTSQSHFPPLPKTPSQSWLWRTLPSVPKRNSFSDSRKISRKTPSTSSKWETVVRTSSLQYDHVHYSEELTTHIPKQSKN